MKLLLIEDEASYRYLIRRILAPAGWTLAEAASLAEGKRILEEEPVQALLLDINLPDGNGYEFCDQFRRAPRFQTLPVLMLTIRSKPEEWIQGFQCGADDYLSKPFEPEELLQRVRDLMAKSSPDVQARERQIHAYGPEHGLVRVAQRGNRRAFEILNRLYAPRLPALVRHWVSSRSSVEDVTAQTMLEAYRTLPRFEHRSSFLTWLAKIGRFMALRTYRIRPTLAIESLKSEPADPLPPADRPELTDQIERVLLKVPPHYREPLMLFAVERKSYQEIADQLQISRGTVMSRLSRAREYFRLAWEKEEE